MAIDEVRDQRTQVNDFAIKLANVNGTGSASANSLLMQAIFRMGIPVSGKNLFPSNIQGLPTWYEIRVNRTGYTARALDYDLVVAMDRRNLADLRRMAPDRATARDRVRLLRSFDPATAGNGHSGGAAARPGRDPYDGDVPDPYDGSAADYALAFDLVQAAASGLAAQLAALIGDGASGAGGGGAGSTGPGGR